MQDIEQDQLPRETISRTKDCNLIAERFNWLLFRGIGWCTVRSSMKKKKKIKQAHRG